MIGRAGKMAILLSDFLEQISVAVGNVNVIMEQAALEQYMQQGYDRIENGAENTAENTILQEYSPKIYSISIKDGGKKVDVPVTALMHNKTMGLDQVDIKIRCKLDERDGKVYVDCKSNNASDETLNEINLSFKNGVSPEGVSRMTDNYLKNI
jgi:hypothetical protein